MVEKVAAGTRERLLAAAERLLLTEPYDEVSVRGICTAAGANPAAVHYHFGSKEALVGALIEDRLGPLWADRLTDVTTAHADSPAAVPAVVDAVLAPFVELAADPVGRLHLRLLARFVMRRQLTAWRLPWFRMDSWVGLLPELAELEARRRWMLAFDLIITQFGSTGDRELSERAVATLRTFVVAGLTAPTGEQQ
ncbi:TetR/AcrR family transcriptional regulator [Nocardia yamanashiensis]|uniref:TetR/AcrR family transcriptional regulator n=1 Tax=Nocardia yamanashiensis TaxID=209247 RepID=UPI00082F0EF9|nr:TetR/AcrR family transcriptional regulator [Nocardia yamanashiensis]UGT41470.1 TetR/AcrR family transcriptional regulator [Nocardia yamanashiensis]